MKNSNKGLDKYQKSRAKNDIQATSVNLKKSQVAFAQKHNINLSKLVRDLLDEYIKVEKMK